MPVVAAKLWVLHKIPFHRDVLLQSLYFSGAPCRAVPLHDTDVVCPKIVLKITHDKQNLSLYVLLTVSVKAQRGFAHIWCETSYEISFSMVSGGISRISGCASRRRKYLITDA